MFLKHNGIPARWHNWPWQTQSSFCITETGFGTGLNFLLTWQAWRNYRSQPSTTNTGWLHFTSIEKYPLSRAQLQQTLTLWPQLETFAAALLKDYPLAISGTHYLSWPEDRISLTLHWDDIKTALPQINGPVHAWYLDGFAPTRNPEMWTDDLFLQLRRLSQRDTAQYHNELPATVATFTAAGHIRRRLTGAGFDVKKQPGYGRKHSILAGQFTRHIGPEQPPYFHYKPWLVGSVAAVKEVIVIGAGLAGCSTARALAERGVRVQLLDQQGIAQQGSGNPQGGLYIKLAANDSAIHTSFYLAAYQYALTYLERYLGQATSDNPYWQQCGMLQLAFDSAEAKRQQQLIKKTPLPHAFMQAVSADQASQIACIRLNQGGLFFPQGGWVSPVDLCHKLIDHPNIHFEPLKVSQIQPTTNGWSAVTDNATFTASDLVLATAQDTTKLLPQEHLPIKFIRGQLSFLKAGLINKLNTVISGNSFIIPNKETSHCIGATFDSNDNNPAIEPKDHWFNLSNLSGISPSWQSLIDDYGLSAIQNGRVGFRCSAPDYLPMLGQIPAKPAFLHSFAHLAKDANRIAKTPAPTVKGLWLNLGHGAKGLVSTPLCAELLAAQLTQSSMPVNNSIIEALWPGRFLLRDLIRRKLTVS